ncbi:MAG: LPS translocon maturation chaperone LptM [Acidobacteriota bacterium]
MARKTAPLVLLLVLLAAILACGRKGDPYPRRTGASPAPPAAALSSSHG